MVLVCPLFIDIFFLEFVPLHEVGYNNFFGSEPWNFKEAFVGEKNPRSVLEKPMLSLRNETWKAIVFHELDTVLAGQAERVPQDRQIIRTQGIIHSRVVALTRQVLLADLFGEKEARGADHLMGRND